MARQIHPEARSGVVSRRPTGRVGANCADFGDISTISCAVDDSAEASPTAGSGPLLRKSEMFEPCGSTAQRGHCGVDLNHGVVAGDLRVLVTRTGEDLSHMSIGSQIQSMLVGGGWKVTVSPVDSAEVLAERRVGRRRTAERLRSSFVRVATEQGIDRAEKLRIARLLGN